MTVGAEVSELFAEKCVDLFDTDETLRCRDPRDWGSNSCRLKGGTENRLGILLKGLRGGAWWLAAKVN